MRKIPIFQGEAGCVLRVHGCMYVHMSLHARVRVRLRACVNICVSVGCGRGRVCT